MRSLHLDLTLSLLVANGAEMPTRRSQRSLRPLPSAEGRHGPSRVSSQASSSLRGTVPCRPLARSPVDTRPVLSGFRPSVAVAGRAHSPFLGCSAALCA